MFEWIGIFSVVYLIIGLIWAGVRLYKGETVGDSLIWVMIWLPWTLAMTISYIFIKVRFRGRY